MQTVPLMENLRKIYGKNKLNNANIVLHISEYLKLTKNSQEINMPEVIVGGRNLTGSEMDNPLISAGNVD